MYDLFLDDPKSIKCKAEISGADIADSKVRLMVETQNRCFYFKGSINNSGEIEIPINSLKGLIPESTQGKMLLELIVEDTLFTPWKTDFTAKLKKKVSVTEIKEESKEVLPKSTKPQVKLVMEENGNTHHINNLVKIFELNNIDILNLTTNKKQVNRIINEYLEPYSLSSKDISIIQQGLINKIIKL